MGGTSRFLVQGGVSSPSEQPNVSSCAERATRRNAAVMYACAQNAAGFEPMLR